jgi:hypothetical protein
VSFSLFADVQPILTRSCVACHTQKSDKPADVFVPPEPDPKAKDPIDRVSSQVQAVGCFFPPTDFLDWGEKNRSTRPARSSLRVGSGRSPELCCHGTLLSIEGCRGLRRSRR